MSNSQLTSNWGNTLVADVNENVAWNSRYLPAAQPRPGFRKQSGTGQYRCIPLVGHAQCEIQVLAGCPRLEGRPCFECCGAQ